MVGRSMPLRDRGVVVLVYAIGVAMAAMACLFHPWVVFNARPSCAFFGKDLAKASIAQAPSPRFLP